MEVYTVCDVDVNQKLQDMNQRIEVLQHQAMDQNKQLSFRSNPPFDERIMRESLPSNFKMPRLESYDGSTNTDQIQSDPTKLLVLPMK